MYRCVQLIFKFFVDTGSCCVAQAGFGLLVSSKQPALASQSAGIRDVSHLSWPDLIFNITNLGSDTETNWFLEHHDAFKFKKPAMSRFLFLSVRHVIFWWWRLTQWLYPTISSCTVPCMKLWKLCIQRGLLGTLVIAVSLRRKAEAIWKWSKKETEEREAHSRKSGFQPTEERGRKPTQGVCIKRFRTVFLCREKGARRDCKEGRWRHNLIALLITR